MQYNSSCMSRSILIAGKCLTEYQKLVNLLIKGNFSVSAIDTLTNIDMEFGKKNYDIALYLIDGHHLPRGFKEKFKSGKITGKKSTICITMDDFDNKIFSNKIIYLNKNVNHFMIYQFIETLLHPKFPDKLFKALMISIDENEKNIITATIERMGCDIEWCNDHTNIEKYLENTGFSMVLINSKGLTLDETAHICKSFKNEKIFFHIPIVVFSAFEFQQDISKLFFSGANDIIHKPFYPEEVWTRLLSHLKMKGLIDELEDKIKAEEKRNLELIELNEELREANDLARRLSKALEEQALTDELTGVYNRRQIVNLTRRAINHAYDYNKELVCMITDIDWFKKINDHYGHDFGDKVIRETALILSTFLENDWYLGRWGGEEFVLVLLGCHIERAKQIAAEINERVKNHVFKSASKNIEARVTVSIGITELKKAEKEKSTDFLIKRADECLYIAKERGRDCYVVSD